MKHTAYNPRLKIQSWIFAVLMTVSAVLGVFPIAAETVSVAEPSDHTETVSTLPPLKLLSFVSDKPLTQAEIQWLDAEGKSSLPAEMTLTYDGTVPHENVALSFIHDGQLTVTAYVYTGDTVGTVWTPTAVTFLEETYPLTALGDGYTATFPCDTEALVTVTVTYEAELAVSAETVNALMNAAYTRGQEINAAYDAYQKALDDHAAATEAYAAYRAALQQYKSDLALYNAYVSAQKAYEDRCALYEAYLEELSVYEQALTVYQAYLEEKAAYDKTYAAYMEYVNRPAEYEKKYLAYCEYLATLEKIKAQLAVTDSCFVLDSVGHMLNATLNGPTVATVVARQDELVSVGVDAVDIANADAATKNLIALLADYPKKKEDAVRYAYYISHYDDIRENVTLLYTSLSRLYKNDAVPDILKMQGRLERYWQFVAQLYSLSCALEDEVAFDPNWSISGAKLTDLLESCFILTDTNTAAPLASYPDPMEPVTAPGEMKMPTAPAVVEQPVAPLKVTEPTPPTAVSKPTLPSAVPSPGQRPTEPLFSTNETALAEAVSEGKLSERPAVTDEVNYPLSVSVGVCGKADGTPVAAFYDYDRLTLLGAVMSHDGTVEFPTEKPTRPSEQGETYTFSGWIDETGKTYLPEDTHTEISQNTAFYALYASQTQKYTVTWNVDGALTEEIFSFGEIPVYNGTPHKEEDETCVYSFVGWSPAVSPVSRDVTYTAVFAAHEKTFEIQWIIGENSEKEEYPLGELPVYSEVPALPMDGRYRYLFKHWSPDIVAVERNAVYTAVFEAVDLLGGYDNAVVSEKNRELTVSFSDDVDTRMLPIDALTEYALENHSSLSFAMGDHITSFSSEAVALLSESDAVAIRWEGLQGHSPFRVCLQDEEGKDVSLDTEARLTVMLSQGQRCEITDGDGQNVSSLLEGAAMALIKINSPYVLRKGYAVLTETTVSGTADTQGGICLPSLSVADMGETVNLTVTAAPGYGVESVTVRDGQGSAVHLTAENNGNYRFIMPEGDVTVTADFKPLTYTVIFRMEDTVISSAIYRYGDKPVIPDAPTRENDDAYSYTFTGWSPTVTAVMGDAVYEAQFMAVPLNGQASVEDNGMNLLQLFLLGFGTFALSCAGILVPYVIVTRRKSAEATAADAEESEVEEV